jgi:hypothetical protein
MTAVTIMKTEHPTKAHACPFPLAKLSTPIMRNPPAENENKATAIRPLSATVRGAFVIVVSLCDLLRVIWLVAGFEAPLPSWPLDAGISPHVLFAQNVQEQHAQRVGDEEACGMPSAVAEDGFSYFSEPAMVSQKKMPVNGFAIQCIAAYPAGNGQKGNKIQQAKHSKKLEWSVGTVGHRLESLREVDERIAPFLVLSLQRVWRIISRQVGVW